MTSAPDAVALLALRDEANVRAFLHMVRVGEGTADADGYRRMFTGAMFDDFSRHPNQTHKAGALASTAAGAYQFLYRTWQECAQALGLRDFSPANQDIAALYLIWRRGALDDVRAGRLNQAIAKCAREWASLPGSPYGQPTRTLAQATKSYLDAGGTLAGSPKETPAMVAPLVAPLIGALASSLIDIFTPLAKEKITKEMARHTDNPQVADQIATNIVDTAKALTGKDDPIDAVAAAKAQPEIVQQVEASALETVERLAPLLDKLAQWDAQSWAAEEASRDAAQRRAQDDPNDQDPYLTKSIVQLTTGILLAGMVLAAALAYFGMREQVAAVISLVTAGAGMIFGKFGTRYDHRYGSSRGSAAKDVVMGALSGRK